MAAKSAPRLATTFGDPRPCRSERFYKIANLVLDAITTGLRWTIRVQLAAIVALLVCAGVVIKHEDIWVSDGTQFSCRVDALQPVQSKEH